MSKAIFTEDDFQEFDDAEDGRYAAKEANSKVAPLFEKLEAQLKVAIKALEYVQAILADTKYGQKADWVYANLRNGGQVTALAEIDRIAKEGMEGMKNK